MMADRANPYQRNGQWFIEIGPFGSSKDALSALLLRIVISRRGQRVVTLPLRRKNRITRRKK